MGKRIFRVLFFCVFAAMLGLGIIAPIMPIYAENLGATGIGLGLIFAGFSLSRGVLMPIIGKMSDRRGRKIFISAGLLIYALVSLGYIGANSVADLVWVRLVHGMGSAMVIPISMAYVGEISPKGKEGIYLGTFNIALFLGMGAGPLLGGFLTDYLGMSSTFYAMFALTALSLILILIFLPEKQDQNDGLEKKRFFSFRQILQNKIMQGIFLFRVVNALGRGAIMSFLPIFANSIKLSSSQIGIILSINVFLMSLLQRQFGKFADKYDKYYLIITGSLMAAIALFFIPRTHTFWELLMTAILMGIGGAIAMPSATALITSLGKGYGMGATMGLFNMAMSIGMTLGPLISGMLMHLIGVKSVFYFGSCILGIGMGMFYWFVNK
ncbi:MAG: MFS transporter [bacterium]